MHLQYPLIVSPEGGVNVTTSNNVVRRGENATFVCSAMGGPANFYTWMMNEDTIGNESTLVVRDIDASSGGFYTCMVSNAAGTDSAYITLFVAPYFTTPLDEQLLTTNGSTVNIICDVTGFPSPTVTWVDMNNIQVSNSALLQFSPVMFGDEGIYRCVAEVEINGMSFNATNDSVLVGMCHNISLS